MADIFGSEDKEKSLYLTQIHYLEEQLERCQLKRKELEKKNKDLASQYSALQKKKKDTTESLKRSVAAKEKKVDELLEQQESQQLAAKQDRDSLELQHSRQMKELQDQIDRLKSESSMQAAKFVEQQKKKELLMELLSHVESLRTQLVSQREDNEAAIDSLMKETEAKRESMIETAQNKVQKNVKKKTTKILRRERALHIERLQQLPFLLKESLILMKEKEVLMDKDKDLCSERDLLKKELNEMTRESFSYKKEVKRLEETVRQLRGELKDLRSACESVLPEEEALRQSLALVTEKSCQKTAAAGQLRAEVERESGRRRRLESVIQEADIILSHILTDSEKTSDTEWKMQRLLEILECTVCRGTGSDVKDSPEKSREGRDLQTTDPKPARASPAPQQADPEASTSSSAGC